MHLDIRTLSDNIMYARASLMSHETNDGEDCKASKNTG